MPDLNPLPTRFKKYILFSDNFILQGGFNARVQEAGVVIIRRRFRHALKNIVPDLLDADCVYRLASDNKYSDRGLLTQCQGRRPS
jgi:hypothetical protein